MLQALLRLRHPLQIPRSTPTRGYWQVFLPRKHQHNLRQMELAVPEIMSWGWNSAVGNLDRFQLFATTKLPVKQVPILVEFGLLQAPCWQA